jgi:ATP-dependent Clp protease ATP-binding subunit ClpA
MECDQGIDRLLEKFVQVLKRKNKSNIILVGRGSNERLKL